MTMMMNHILFFVIDTTANMSEQDALLKRLYYNLRKAGSFAGLNSLYSSAKRLNPNIKKEYVARWLQNQNIYLRHKRDRKPRGRSNQYSKWLVTNKNLSFSCDTGYIPHSKLSYLLVCRDSFTNKLLAAPQRGLKAETTKRNFQKLITDQNDSIYPHTIYTDR